MTIMTENKGKCYIVLLCCIGFLLLLCLLKEQPASKEKMLALQISRCSDNMRKIFNAFNSYSADFKRYPKTFDCLIRSKYLNCSLFVCPSNKSVPCGYDYFAGNYPYSDEWELFPILHDKIENHPDAVNVLMSDGIVITVPSGDIDDAIVKYTKCFKTGNNYIPFQKRYPPTY